MQLWGLIYSRNVPDVPPHEEYIYKIVVGPTNNFPYQQNMRTKYATLARILVQVKIYRGHLDQSEAYDIS